ncbi:MAG: recombinase family protein [Thermodesulfobacteriota bacterium]|jgi:site-specific DNA recombinase
MAEKLLKVAGYIRVSTPGQAQEGESLSTQTDQIAGFVKAKGWKLVKQYEDRGLSGAKADTRPGFMAMIEDAKKGMFQGIVFSRLSRFARNTADFLKYQKELKDKGVSLFSLKEGIDPSTKMGEFAMKLMSLFAEWERETIKEQMHDNKLARWRDGRTFVGKPPFGYVWNGEAKRLEVNEKEATIYREIVKMYAGLSLSMKDIAIKLGDRGLKAKKKPFSSVVISDILKNSAYYGHYVLNKYVYEDGKRMDGKKDKKLKPESEHIVFEIPPLISKKEWEAIQVKTDFNKTKSKRSSYDQKLYWLRDLLVCGECGGTVKPHHGANRKDGSFPRYYSCYWAMGNGKAMKLAKNHKCDLPYIRAERLETEVWNAIMKPYLFHSGSFKGGTWIPSKMGELLDSSHYDKAIKQMGKTVESLQADLKKLNTARERIFDLIEDDRFDKNEMSRRLNRNKEETLIVEGKIKEARQKLTQAEEAKKNDVLYREFLKDKKGVLKKLAADLYKLSPDDMKRLAEGSINGKVKLVLGYDETKDTEIAIPKLEASSNMALLKQLMEEGKIGKFFSKDGSHDPSGYEF